MFAPSFNPPLNCGDSSGNSANPWRPMARAVYMHSPALPIDAPKTVDAAESRRHKIVGYDIPFVMLHPEHQQFATISSAEGIGTSERQQTLPQSNPTPRGSISARGPRSSLLGLPRVSLVVDPYQALTDGMLTSRTSNFPSVPVTPKLPQPSPLSTARSHQLPTGFDYKVVLPTPRGITVDFNPSTSAA